jgi:hypothetical protein
MSLSLALGLGHVLLLVWRKKSGKITDQTERSRYFMDNCPS